MIEQMLRWRCELADDLAAAQLALDVAETTLGEAEARVVSIRQRNAAVAALLAPLAGEGLAPPLERRRHDLANELRDAEQRLSNARNEASHCRRHLAQLHAAMQQIERLIPLPEDHIALQDVDADA